MSASATPLAERSTPTPTLAVPQPLRALLAVWRWLVQVQHDLESTPWGQLLIANVWPAYLFALPLGARIWAFVDRLRGEAGSPTPAGTDPLRFQVMAAQELLTIAFYVLVVVLFVVRRPLIGRHADWKGGAVALAGTFLLYGVGFVPVAGEPSTQAFLLSAAIIVLGTLFTFWSLAALGRCFGLFPEARGLVTRGPYRWVRHPVYLGELISAFGILVVKPHPVIVAMYLGFIGLQYWRSRYEERALLDAFPDSYAAYRARTGRLLPRWR